MIAATVRMQCVGIDVNVDTIDLVRLQIDDSEMLTLIPVANGQHGFKVGECYNVAFENVKPELEKKT